VRFAPGFVRFKSKTANSTGRPSRAVHLLRGALCEAIARRIGRVLHRKFPSRSRHTGARFVCFSTVFLPCVVVFFVHSLSGVHHNMIRRFVKRSTSTQTERCISQIRSLPQDGTQSLKTFLMSFKVVPMCFVPGSCRRESKVVAAMSFFCAVPCVSKGSSKSSSRYSYKLS
jgi:uncharacterized membrane protein